MAWDFFANSPSCDRPLSTCTFTPSVALVYYYIWATTLFVIISAARPFLAQLPTVIHLFVPAKINYMYLEYIIIMKWRWIFMSESLPSVILFRFTCSLWVSYHACCLAGYNMRYEFFKRADWMGSTLSNKMFAGPLAGGEIEVKTTGLYAVFASVSLANQIRTKYLSLIMWQPFPDPIGWYRYLLNGLFGSF